ncbi:MAG: hypothetical protein J6V27_01910 [Alistipes sp.]|nr:hypothetical protein [Alistipes sp.]
MDIVITYVNGLDPEWQRLYEQYTSTPILEKRFRDWGTLKYLFRGIQTNMPFIRKVHLVVSGMTQIPEWINRQEVNVVLHSDIIPEEYLPTFNCNPIEMHLHRIKDLDEEFLYFNDDMFPVRRCQPTDFFRGGKGVIRMTRHLFAFDMFKKICRNSSRVAHEALGRKNSIFFLRPQHICSPMLKSECEELYAKVEPMIKASISRVRTSDNLNQYMFINYAYLKGKIINEPISKKHFSVGIVSASKLHQFIVQPTHKMACINDVQLSEERYVELHKILHDSFEELFPQKSKFEI